MKYGLIILLNTAFIFLLTLNSKLSAQQKSSARMMSYNIKFDDKTDTVNSWDKRKERVLNLISFYEPDFLGTQEALLHQLQYLEKGLENMDWIGVARADGKREGEFSALFYNTTQYELVEDSDSTIWLSETPGEPSKSWDAALPRILTWGRFRNKSTGEELLVFNTHFDHIGDTARTEGARLIIDTINRVAGDTPVVLMGDFNAVEDSEPYSILTDSDKALQDAFYKSSEPHVGPLFTFEGFKVMGSAHKKRRIDFIFVNGQVEVLKHAIISDFRAGRYPSDHLPVIAEIRLQ